VPYLIVPDGCVITEHRSYEKTLEDGSKSKVTAIWSLKRCLGLVQRNPYAEGWTPGRQLCIDDYGFLEQDSWHDGIERWIGLDDRPEDEQETLVTPGEDWDVLREAGWEDTGGGTYYQGKLKIYETEGDHLGHPKIDERQLMKPPTKAKAERKEGSAKVLITSTYNA